MTTPILEARDLIVTRGRKEIVRVERFAVRPWRSARADRAERRRQEHAAARPERALPGARRAPASRARLVRGERDRRRLRRRTAAVFQQPFLLATTVRGNVESGLRLARLRRRRGAGASGGGARAARYRAPCAAPPRRAFGRRGPAREHRARAGRRPRHRLPGRADGGARPADASRAARGSGAHLRPSGPITRALGDPRQGRGGGGGRPGDVSRRRARPAGGQGAARSSTGRRPTRSPTTSGVDVWLEGEVVDGPADGTALPVGERRLPRVRRGRNPAPPSPASTLRTSPCRSPSHPPARSVRATCCPPPCSPFDPEVVYGSLSWSGAGNLCKLL